MHTVNDNYVHNRYVSRSQTGDKITAITINSNNNNTINNNKGYNPNDYY